MGATVISNGKYGLTYDNVVEAQVVCADGQIRIASAEDNPDLFWAIRGGVSAITTLALDRPSPLSLSFPERSAPFMVAIEGHWSDSAQNTECIGWIQAAVERIDTYGNDAAYVN